MRIWMGFAVSLATTGIATAQPAGPPPTTPETPVAPPVETAPPAPVPEPPPPPPVEPAMDSGRPAELSFGIGVGYAFPTSLQTPNVTSVRVRLPTGLTFEPQLVFARSTDEVDNATTVTNKQTEITIGSLVRYPLRVRRRIDFELIGAAAVSNRTVNPNGADNDRTITAIGLSYGLGLAYWFTPHWNLSLTSTNPLVSYVRTRQEMGPDMETTDKATTFGLVFDPVVTLMIHLHD